MESRVVIRIEYPNQGYGAVDWRYVISRLIAEMREAELPAPDAIRVIEETVLID